MKTEHCSETGVISETPDRLLELACKIGACLIRNGAEMYRVEESVKRVLSAYGMSENEIFATPSLIIVCIESDGRNYTKSVRVKDSGNNLERLRLLNTLCREICSGSLTYDNAIDELRSISEKPLYPLWISYIASGVAAFFFALFWGGTPIDAAAAFAAGLIVKLTMDFSNRFRTNLFFSNVLSGCCLSVLPILLSAFFPQLFHLDKIIIGVIMLLVPGVAIANVIRDVLAGDTLTAITKFAEVLIIGIGIAIGIAIPIAAFQTLLASLY